MPSGPYDAKGLLLASLSAKQEDPIVFMEPKKIYRSFKEEVPDKSYEIPLGKANIVHEGNDITLVTYGATLQTVLKARSELKDHFDIEVVDLRTLSPIDEDLVLSSARKTGRVLIAHEAPKTLGLGSEISALISENAIEFMKAPIIRVTGYDVPMPLARSEDYYIPSVERVAAGIKELMNYPS